MLDYFLFYILLCLEGAYAPNAPLPSGLNVSVSQTLNKHLDTQRPVATAADCVAIDHFRESQSEHGGLPGLLLAYPCQANYSKAALL